MDYFKFFPKIEYNNLIATDITVRFIPIQNILNKLEVFYEYTLDENERPEDVAYKFYKDVKYDYIIKIMNNVNDVYYDWYMSYDVFNKYIVTKYGNESIAKNTIYEYRHIIQRADFLNNIPKKYNIVDQKTYNQLEAFEREIVYAYDYEVEKNDSKKTIKILDSQFIPLVEKERESIFNVR